jgi:hypothetical protein
MTPDEASLLLAVASAFDYRMTPPSVDDARIRARAWSEVLDDDLDFQDARQLVMRHYAENDESMTPARLNRSWRLLRKKRKDEATQERNRLREIEADLVASPMPDEVRDLLRQLGMEK